MTRFLHRLTGLAFVLAISSLGSAPAHAQINVGLPTIQAGVGEQIEIEITVDDLTGQEIFAYDFSLVYDEALLNITSPAVTSGTLSQGKSVIVNAAKQDTVRVVAASATAFSGGGVLVKLKGTVLAEGTTPLTFSNFTFNDGVPTAVLGEGELSAGSLPPTADPVTVETDEDVAVTITLQGSHPEGAALGFGILDGPEHGVLGEISVAGATTATILYTPDPDFNGSDSFTYRTSAGGQQSAAATVTITVLPVNDAPIAHPDTAFTDAGLAVIIDAVANDEDVEGDELTAEPDPANPPTGGTVSANPDGTLLYAPNEGFAGEDTFGYFVVDANGGRSGGTVVVNVRALVDLSISVEDTPDPVAGGGTLRYQVSVANAGPSMLGRWVLAVELPGDATFSNADDAGCAYDAGTHIVSCEGEGVPGDITIELTAPNAPGTILTGSASVSVISTGSLRQHDPESGNNSVVVTTDVETDADGVADDEEAGVPNRFGEGTGDGNGDGIPDAEQKNVASLQNSTDGGYVTIEAEAGASLAGVQSSPTPPAEAPPPPAAVTFGDGFLSFAVEEIAAGAATTITIYTSNEANSYVKYGPTPDNPEAHWYEFLYDGTTGAEILADRIVLHFVDGSRGDGDLSVNGSVQDPGGPVFNVNSSPVAASDVYQIEEDQELTVSPEEGVLANDSDPDGDDLRVTLVSDVTNGALTLNADGSFSYMPEENFNGSDGFTYAVTDGLASDTADVTILIAAVNDAPGVAEIISPAGGSAFIVGGSAEPLEGGTVLFDIAWDEVTDVDGDAVVYRLEIAGDEAFVDVIDAVTVGSELHVSVTIAQAAAWVDAIHGGAQLDASATVYARANASDGELETQGTVSSFVLTRGTITGRGDDAGLPERFELRGNYPNPFNPSTTIVFDLPLAGQVRVQLFDMLGREVLALAPRPMNAGAGQRVEIDAASLPSGLYIYRVTAELGENTKTAAGHLTLIK